jgi:hypothetical protein
VFLLRDGLVFILYDPFINLYKDLIMGIQLGVIAGLASASMLLIFTRNLNIVGTYLGLISLSGVGLQLLMGAMGIAL